MTSRTIVAFGDSLTAGKGLDEDDAYPAVLERMLASAGLPFSVKNHGFAGDTSADAVKRLDRALAEMPAVMIVALGDRLFPALAEKYNVALVPFLLNGVIGNPQMVRQDHVHPNAAGAAEIARTIWPYLQPLATRLAETVTI